MPELKPNLDKPEPNKDFTTKGTKNEFLMVLWPLRVLRDLRGEQEGKGSSAFSRRGKIVVNNVAAKLIGPYP
jgi:hypothetical protein